MKNIRIQELEVPAVALGTWSWGVGGIAGGDTIFGNHYEKSDLKPVFDYAMAQGLTMWDTATVYASGASETLLGEFVENRSEAIVSTKFTPVMAQGMGNEAMMQFLDASRKRLHKDIIDIYWIHNTDDVERWARELIPVLKSGKVKKVGVSNHNLEQIKTVQGILKEAGYQLHAIQNHYSLLYRNIDTTGIIEYCKEQNIAIFAYMVLEQGALSGKYTKENPLPAESRRGQAFPPETLGKLQPLFDELHRLAVKYDATSALIATAWAIGRGVIPIIGVTKINQVDDAVKAASVSLTPDELDRLEQVAINTGVTVKGEWEESM